MKWLSRQFTNPKEYFDIDAMDADEKKEVLRSWKEFKRFVKLCRLCDIGLKNAVDVKNYPTAATLLDMYNVLYKRAYRMAKYCEDMGFDYLNPEVGINENGIGRYRSLVLDYLTDYELKVRMERMNWNNWPDFIINHYAEYSENY